MCEPRAAGEILAFPGAGWAQKRWPPEHWVALARTLQDAGLPVALLCSPEESGLRRQLVSLLDSPVKGGGSAPAIVCQSTSGDELLRRLGRARAVVSNDAGAAHLAAAMGIPTIALFGPTNPAICGPLGPRVTILRAPCAERPEGRQHHCHDQPAFRCERQGMRAIPVADVRTALRDLLAPKDRTATAHDAGGAPARTVENRCGS